MKQTLIAYSFSHFVVDFLCAFTIFSFPNFYPELTEQMLFYIILYGVLAFGLQVLFGAIGDRVKKPKFFALLGISLNILALGLLFLSPLIATILTGIGNALFHVGGGLIALHLGKKKATLPGIFVSTGAMGVFLGTFLPVYTSFSPRYLLGLGVLTFLFLLITKLPSLQWEKAEVISSLKPSLQHRIFLICFFILLSIFIRSVIGFLVPFPRKSGFLLGFLFT
jgi:FSR family fosmidomycin resistance protein-like MFS transporter